MSLQQNVMLGEAQSWPKGLYPSSSRDLSLPPDCPAMDCFSSAMCHPALEPADYGLKPLQTVSQQKSLL